MGITHYNVQTYLIRSDLQEEGGKVVEENKRRVGDAPSSSILTGLGFFFSAMRWRLSSSSMASETRFASCSAAIRRSRSADVSFGGGAIARARGSSFEDFGRLGAILEGRVVEVRRRGY